MTHPMLATLLCLTPLAPLAAAQQVRDPRPPRVHALEPIEAPTAEAFDGLTFHAAPRPLPEGALTSDWPGFLGARRDGHSRETGLALAWGATGPRLVWEAEVGEGYAQPVVGAGRVVLLHRQGAESHVDCLDAETGRRYWRRSFPCAFRPRYVRDAGPRATPTIDGERVYVHSVEGRLMCLELTTGRLHWERDLRAEFGLSDGFFGVVSSPLLRGEHLFVNVGTPGPSVACFEKRTGRWVWGTGAEWGASCASPVLRQVHGRERLFVMTGGESDPPTGGLMVLDPADGSLDFSYPFRSRTRESVNAASPLVIGDDVFLTASYGVGSAVLSLDAEGGFEERWRDRHALGLQFSNPVEVAGKVYAIDGSSDRVGELVCLEPGTGKELSRTPLTWDERVVYQGQEREQGFSVGEGSLLVVQGKLLCLGDQGHLLWLEPRPEGVRVLARASLFRARESWTPPALSRGLLYVRQTSREGFGREPRPRRVVCFDLRAGEG